MVLKEIRKQFNINVESGAIIITTPDKLIEEGGKSKGAVSVPKGKYKFTATVVRGAGWFNPHTLHTKGEIDLTEGLLLVNDPGEFFPVYTKWDAFLNKTKYLKKLPEGLFAINTGGDGTAVVEVCLKKIK